MIQNRAMGMLIGIKKITKSKLLQESLIYGLTNALYSGLPLLLLPFLVAILSPKDYGIMDFFRVYSLVMASALGLSTVQSISRFYYDLESGEFKTYVTTVIIFNLFTAILGGCISLFVGHWLPPDFRIISWLGVIFFFFNQSTEALLAIFRVQKKVLYYLYIRVGGVLLELLLLTIFYFTFRSYDWSYKVYPNVIATVFVGALSLFILFQKRYRPVFNAQQLKVALSYSSPLVIHLLSAQVLNLGDRFFILHYLNDAELGRYAVAYQVGMSVNFFFTSFNLAWIPTFFEWMKQGKQAQIKRVQKIVYLLVPFLGLLVFSGYLLIKGWIPGFKKYNIPDSLVLIITVAYVILSLYKFNCNYFLFFKKTRLLSTITFISALITIVLNFILVPRVGIMGAAIATVASILFLYLVVFKKLNDVETAQKNQI